MARAMDTRLNMTLDDISRQVEGFVRRYYGSQARKYPSMQYDDAQVRVTSAKVNPHISGACNPWTRAANPDGECASPRYEVQAQCHIDCRHEYLVEAYYSENAGTLVAVATCGAMSVWMD